MAKTLSARSIVLWKKYPKIQEMVNKKIRRKKKASIDSHLLN